MDVATRIGILHTGQTHDRPDRQEEHHVSCLVQALVDGLDFSQWSSDTSFERVDSSAASSTNNHDAKTPPTEPEPINFESGKCKDAIGSLQNAVDMIPSLTPRPTNLTKRKLEFGQDLTPEVGRQRAVPGASSSKRGLDLKHLILQRGGSRWAFTQIILKDLSLT